MRLCAFLPQCVIQCRDTRHEKAIFMLQGMIILRESSQLDIFEAISCLCFDCISQFASCAQKDILCIGINEIEGWK
jgi:hypothetical protein